MCLVLLTLAFGLRLSATASADVVVRDGLGGEVRLLAPARRIVALYGGFNEILLDMGLGDRLVARTKADEHIPCLESLPSVGTHMRPNLELVVGLRPDLVVQLSGRKGASQAVEGLRRHGIPVAEFNPRTFEELFATITALGRFAGAEDKAQALVDKLTSRLDAVSLALSGTSHRPRVVFEVRWPNLLVAGQRGLVSEVIERAGGQNPVSGGKKLVRLGEEGLYALDPDWYLAQKGAMNPDPKPARRDLFRNLRAVKSGRVVVVDEGLYSRPGPRAVLAVEQLVRILHPAQMKTIQENQ